MQMILSIFVILFTAVCAMAKEVTLQITGVEALTITIPDEWEAHVDQIKGMEKIPGVLPEMIIVGPPMNMGPFSVGDDIPKEQPFISIHPEPQLYKLSELMSHYGFIKPPHVVDDGESSIRIEYIYDSTGNATGYYEAFQDKGIIRFHARINTSERTWTATAKYSPNNKALSQLYAAIINSMNGNKEISQSDFAQLLASLKISDSDTHEPPATATAQPKRPNLSKIPCPRCKGEKEAMAGCPLCGKRGYIWVDSTSDTK